MTLHDGCRLSWCTNLMLPCRASDSSDALRLASSEASRVASCARPEFS